MLMLEWLKNLSEAWQIAIFTTGAAVFIAIIGWLSGLFKWLFGHLRASNSQVNQKDTKYTSVFVIGDVKLGLNVDDIVELWKNFEEQGRTKAGKVSFEKRQTYYDRVVQQASCKLFLGSQFRYYSDITAQLESDLGCQIRLVPLNPDENKKYTNAVVVVTRMVCIRKSSEDDGVYTPQHGIAFDRTLPPVAAARLIAHDIYHIWRQRPENPKWDNMVDQETGLITYGSKIEREADEFSLRLLKSTLLE